MRCRVRSRVPKPHCQVPRGRSREDQIHHHLGRVKFQMGGLSLQVPHGVCYGIHCFAPRCHGLVTATWYTELAITTYMLRRDCWPLSSSFITARGSISLEREPNIATSLRKRTFAAGSLGWHDQKRRPRTLSRVETLVLDPLK